MFLAILEEPYISGTDKDVHFSAHFFVIDASTETEAMGLIKSLAPKKEEELVRIFMYHDERKRNEDEYFTVQLYEVPAGQKIISIPPGDSIFLPKPGKTIKF